MWEQWFENFYKKHPELLEEVRKAEEAVEKAVRELKPPKAVDIILSKLEAVREQAEWMGM